MNRKEAGLSRAHMKLDDSISAVVTGGASGLGEAAVRALAALGVKVAIFDLNEEYGEAIARSIGGVFCKVNITSDAEVEAGFAKARSANGQERVLVNCAGGDGRPTKTASRDKKTGVLRHYPIDQFERTVQLNLVGTFRVIAKSAVGMLTLEALEGGERGAIVNTASAAAEDGQVGQVAYAGSKAGIVGMTLPIARDLMDEGIRINTILPGIFSTPPMNAVPENIKAVLNASVPFPKRMGKPPEFASFVVELLRNPYFNGEDIRLDGAIRMPPR
jgi:NAD(P)-dependent dehydrogenase (short-subunit alcohol dehydrogenase family)